MAESVPTWDLNCLYSGIEDERIKQDIDAIKDMVAQMNLLYLGRLNALDADAWVRIFDLLEKMGFIEGRIGAFFVNITNTNLDSPQINAWKQDTIERLNDIGKEQVAFSLELQKLPRDYVESILADERLKRYRLVFEKALMNQLYALTEDLEKLEMDMGTVSASGWKRFCGELTTAHADFKYCGKKVLLSDLDKLLRSADKTKRVQAGKALGKVYKEQLWMNSLAYNMFVKSGQISCKWHKYPKYNSSRNMDNLLDDEVVDALSAAVKTYGYPISRAFYKAKAKHLGDNDFTYWDRMSPLEFSGRPVSSYSWNEALETVCLCFKQFDPEFETIVRSLIADKRVDASAKNGKNTGAYMVSCNSQYPAGFVLLNFKGTQDDVKTMAHEFGHAIHTYYVQREGDVLSDYGMALAETASTFFETVVFQHLLKNTDDRLLRKTLIGEKLSDEVSTIMRQMAFYDFELQAWTAREKAELQPEQLSTIYNRVLSDYLGDAVKLDDTANNQWGFIGHFYSPFYVYSYAFGMCLTNALFTVYKQGKAANFTQLFKTFMQESGKKKPRELVSLFGLDIADPSFWQMGLQPTKDLLDEFVRD